MFNRKLKQENIALKIELNSVRNANEILRAKTKAAIAKANLLKKQLAATEKKLHEMEQELESRTVIINDTPSTVRKNSKK